MVERAIRFVNLRAGEQPPQTGDWVLLRHVAPGRYDLFLAPSLAARLLRNPVTNLNGSIRAVAQAEHLARLAGLSVVYVNRVGAL
jgi:hypothetical protein